MSEAVDEALYETHDDEEHQQQRPQGSGTIVSDGCAVGGGCGGGCCTQLGSARWGAEGGGRAVLQLPSGAVPAGKWGEE